MEIRSIQKKVNTTPRKLQLVADLVRTMNVASALQTLRFVNKAAAKDLAKAIQTASANARMQNLDSERMIFKKLEINQGTVLKRGRAGSKGRYDPIKKRSSNVTIVLTDEMKKPEDRKIGKSRKSK